MNKRLQAALLPLAIASLFAVSSAMAQNVTSSAVSGRVLDAGGQPVANATVQIVHVPSGTTKVVTTDVEGRYNAQGLRVGGPFDITASKQGVQGEKDDVYLQLGQKSAINLVMQPSEQAAQNLGGVTVTASALASIFAPENKGLSTNISQRQLEATPQGNRSIDDIARLDPRINVVDQGDGSISANGQNNRYNNITVDGLSIGDPFGLNANGLPVQATPISVDTIAEYNISTANFDVSSDTVGADINAVTKSGTNEFHGSAYYAYRNAKNFVGNRGDGDYNGYDQDWTGGITLGGPIVKDKLFFFLSLEQEKTTGIGAESQSGLDPSLDGGPSTSNKLSPGDLQRVIDVANDLGLQPGTFNGSTSATLEDKRYLGKIDWNINDAHRASFSFQRTDETLPEIRGNSFNSVGLSSYSDVKAITTDNYSLQFFDDWTDNFSTETKIGYQHFVQDTNIPAPQPQVQVHAGGFRGPTVNLGAEQFRHYNAIDTKKSSLFFAGTYYADEHTIKGGIAVENTKIYNLFGRTEFGAYTFDTIDDFANGNYYEYDLYQPAPGYTLDDVAAKWTYRQYSPFLQDTWQLGDNLSVQYGVRVDIPDANHKPPYNQEFEQTFGFPNNNTLGFGNKLVEPRFSFNYQFDTERMTQLRGGFGLFQTFPPAVWLTNPYQNNGLTVATYRSFDPDSAPFSPDPFNQNIPAGGPSSSRQDVDSISNDFQLPSVWKTVLALDHELPWWGLVGSVEYQHIKNHNAIFYKALNIGTPSGTLPDGRFQYWTIPGANPRADGNGPNNGANPDFANLSTLLTNTSSGRSDSLTLALSKPLSDNWFGNVSITYNDATEVNEGDSSQASSGYQYVERVNPNEEIATTAARSIEKAFKASLTWQHHFFGDYKTQASLFYSGHSGLPYSWVFSGDANGDGISYEDLAYIPAANDPLVDYGNADPSVVQQFNDFVANDPYLSSHRGQIAERNGARSPWVNQFDVSFEQEVPGFFKGAKGVLRLDIFNFLNLLNSDWGDVQRTFSGFGTRNLAGYDGVNDQGQYVYYLPTDADGNYQADQYETYDHGFNPSRTVSRWSALVTLRYTF